jgi:hypothetical protein
MELVDTALIWRLWGFVLGGWSAIDGFVEKTATQDAKRLLTI